MKEEIEELIAILTLINAIEVIEYYDSTWLVSINQVSVRKQQLMKTAIEIANKLLERKLCAISTTDVR